MTKNSFNQLTLIKRYAQLRWVSLWGVQLSKPTSPKKAVFVIGSTASRRRLNRQVPRVAEEFPQIATSYSDTIGF